jgi:hypothetical protein
MTDVSREHRSDSAHGQGAGRIEKAAGVVADGGKGRHAAE